MSGITPSKIICVGKNYARHAAEMGGHIPLEPLIFFKPPSAVISSGEAIVIPKGVGRVDYEGEIGIIIGTRCRNLHPDAAWEHVEALVPVNDVTARDLQKSDNQWTRAKGFDSFCPVGTPVPVDGVDVGSLIVTTRVNGRVRQHGVASDMSYDIPAIIAFISSIMTLERGDLIATGTPEGIGPLTAGDEVVVEVSGVGSVTNPVVCA